MFGFGKGSVEIKLDKYEYSPGDTIKGTAVLKIKKPVKARGFVVELLAEQKTMSRTVSVGGSRSSGRSQVIQTIFDFKKQLDGEKEYVVGERSYPFQINIPKDISKKPQAGGVLAVISALQSQSGPISWYVIARLDVPSAIDISKKVQINVV